MQSPSFVLKNNAWTPPEISTLDLQGKVPHYLSPQATPNTTKRRSGVEPIHWLLWLGRIGGVFPHGAKDEGPFCSFGFIDICYSALLSVGISAIVCISGFQQSGIASATEEQANIWNASLITNISIGTYLIQTVLNRLFCLTHGQHMANTIRNLHMVDNLLLHRISWSWSAAFPLLLLISFSLPSTLCFGLINLRSGLHTIPVLHHVSMPLQIITLSMYNAIALSLAWIIGMQIRVMEATVKEFPGNACLSMSQAWGAAAGAAQSLSNWMTWTTSTIMISSIIGLTSLAYQVFGGGIPIDKINAWNWTMILYNTECILLFTHLPHWVQEQIKRLDDTLLSHQRENIADKETRDKLAYHLHLHKTLPIEFNMAGYYDLNRPLSISILSTIANYTVILIQFNAGAPSDVTAATNSTLNI